MEGELELCSLGDSLSICEGARHAAEDAVVNFNHLVDGLGRHILPKEKDGEGEGVNCRLVAQKISS